jgi:hypothetical protein
VKIRVLQYPTAPEPLLGPVITEDR